MKNEEAIEIIEGRNFYCIECIDRSEECCEALNMAIKALEQEPKTGHWIELGYVGNDNYNFECSECHHTDTHSKEVKVNYCWCCGAKMNEPQESESKLYMELSKSFAQGLRAGLAESEESE